MSEQEIQTDQQKTILAAVRWWSNRLRKINIRGINDDAKKIDDDNIEIFESLLTIYLLDRVNRGSYSARL